MKLGVSNKEMRLRGWYKEGLANCFYFNSYLKQKLNYDHPFVLFPANGVMCSQLITVWIKYFFWQIIFEINGEQSVTFIFATANKVSYFTKSSPFSYPKWYHPPVLFLQKSQIFKGAEEEIIGNYES